MTITQLIAIAGPYYVIGFLITFFTLMSARYTLGYDIHPHRKFVRICFMSVFWFASLLVSAIIISFKRGRDMVQYDRETTKLRSEVESLKTTLNEVTSQNETIKPAQEFSVDDLVKQSTKRNKKRLKWW